MNIENIMSRLKGQLKEERYLHSVNVMNVSAELARHYNADENKARLAGILHDCAKGMKGEEAVNFVKSIGYCPDEIELIQTGLLHGIIGAHFARTEYGVEDKEVLDAIRWHTTGRAGMSVLEKIIYVADYIEPLRNFEGIEMMRKAAFEDLDRCVVLCAESTIRYVLNKGFLLHEKTVETRNYSLRLLKKL